MQYPNGMNISIVYYDVLIYFQSFPCEPGYKTKKDCFKLYPNITCTACSERDYKYYCFNYFTNATCMTCTECDVLASACAISQYSFCELSNDTQKNDTQRNDTQRNDTHMNNKQEKDIPSKYTFLNTIKNILHIACKTS
jgi:N12 class adenine-specific DNA methylase